MWVLGGTQIVLLWHYPWHGIMNTSELMHCSILLMPELLVSSFAGQWWWPTVINALVTEYIRIYHTFHSEINDLFSSIFQLWVIFQSQYLFFCAIGSCVILSAQYTFYLLRPAGPFLRKHCLCLILHLQHNYDGPNGGSCVLRASMLGCSWWCKKDKHLTQQNQS